MEEEQELSLTISWPFLATGRVLIDVPERTVTLRVNEEQVTFNICQAKKAPKKVKLATWLN